MKKNKINNPDVSIVVPVYNSQGCTELLYKRLSKVLTNKNWELILVNDCSIDNSWNVLKKLAENNKNVVAVNLMNNFGQHNAVMCGLKLAKGKYVITMDDDLQHPPEEVPKLLNGITDKGFKVVYGQYKQKKHGLFRDFVSKSVNRFLSKVTGTGYIVTSFRAIEKSVVKEMTKFDNFNIMIDVLIKDIVSNKKIGHCRVQHHRRRIGKSNYSFRRLASYALNMIFNYTLWPLRIATILGFVFAGLSVLLGVFYFVYFLTFGIDVKGWTSLMLLITFFSGVILFVLGIFGEYLGKIYLNISHKPQYIIENIVIKKRR